MELLGLVRSMLSTDRDARPTASQVKEQLAAIATKLFAPTGEKCNTCQQDFISVNALRKHVKKAGHGRKAAVLVTDFKTTHCVVETHSQMAIRGAADAIAKYHYDDAELDAPDPSPCAVCNKHFKTKRQFFAHLSGGPRHYRSAKYVMKRKAENDLTDDKEYRFTKWMCKDMQRHD
jgi:hypothetical protein